jgi:hypothetical protein
LNTSEKQTCKDSKNKGKEKQKELSMGKKGNEKKISQKTLKKSSAYLKKGPKILAKTK